MINPFIANKEFGIKVISIIATSSSNINGTTGSLLETRNQFLVEEQQSINLYKTGNSKEYTNFLFSILSCYSRDLLLYIMANISKDGDIIQLVMEKVCKETKMSKNTYYRALNTLVENSIIALYKRGRYWINPYFFFRGNRVNYYRNNNPESISVVNKVHTEWE